MDESALRDVLQGLLQGVDRRNAGLAQSLEDLPALRHAAQAIERRDVSGFRRALGYPVDSLMDGLFARLLPQARAAWFLLKHEDFVRAHYRRWIERVEGSCCCADKTATVLNALLRFLADGRRIEFDQSNDRAFNIPRIIFTSHDEILGFFEALRSLYSGFGDKYIGITENLGRNFPTQDGAG